nr:MAG TPA: hypothetical protein [Caudoviricetes sp.]
MQGVSAVKRAPLFIHSYGLERPTEETALERKERACCPIRQ